MLTQRKKTKKLFFNHIIILDIEGFECGKKPVIIKELSVCSANTIDTIHFLPPVQFNNLSKEQKKAYNWVSKFLHGLTGFVGTKVNTLTHTWIKFLTALV